MSNEKWLARWQNVMMPSYQSPKLTLARGEGAHVWDVDGNRYVDLLAGLAVNVLGHAHPNVVEAVAAQMRTLGHVSNLYANEPSIELAERLLELFGSDSGTGKVFFCNSGAEANEAAFKLSRRTGRPNIVAMTNGFHGRTMGALAMTGQLAKQLPFAPLPAHVVHVPFGDADALRQAVDSDTAAVIVEPILGEAGVVMPPAGFLTDVREITRAAGALMIVDEVQTGFGRTGAWFAYQWEQVQPDVVTLAKGLGGGMPIGACVAFGEAATLFEPGQHGTTFGGNPVVAAAALAVINTIHAEGLVSRSAALGRKLMIAINDLQHPLIEGVRGRGLFAGIGLTENIAPQTVAAAARSGYLVNAPAPNVLRVAPPLVISENDIDGFVAALPEILKNAYVGGNS
jgi:acetylornithine/N-succinyldiaminopimelate aminotransferase